MIIVKTKKQMFTTALTTFLGIACGVIVGFSPHMGVFSPGKSVKCVIIDPGHGMPDGGAVGVGGTVEQRINLEIAKKTAEVLEGKGFSVILTREDDNSLAKESESIRNMKVEDMRLRKELMTKSNADIFISIHMNSFPDKKVSGLRMFYSANHPELEGMAKDIQKGISDITGAKAYAVKAADKSLFLMKNPPVPAILAECGFLSNPEEEKKLNDEKYQAKIAWAIAGALENYYR